MTESAVVFSNASTSAAAGREIGEGLRAGLSGHSPDALILFASSRYDHRELLQTIHESCRPAILVGSSSAGEFVSHRRGEGATSAIGLRSTRMKFAAGIGRTLSADRRAAAVAIAGAFQGVSSSPYLHRSALVLADALAGFTEEFIEHLNIATLGDYRLFGGGAGDDGHFARTHVFFGMEVATDAAVALEILSQQPIGVGVSHGWVCAGEPLRVTEANGSTLISLNSMPAFEAFAEHAEKTGQTFDRSDPLPFFLHNVIGIETGGGYKLRVPLHVNADGSIACASDIPAGATVHIMKTSEASAAQAAMNAATSAMRQLGDAEPEVAIFFDCVATRLRMGGEFGLEMDALQQTLGEIRYAGCNTYGQIARSEGQFSGFHNCTATVALLPG